MKSNDPYLDGIWRNCEDLDEVRNRLYTLAKAFYMTGNNGMGDELSHISDGCNNIAKGIRSTVTQEISRGADQAAANTAEVFKAILDRSLGHDQT